MANLSVTASTIIASADSRKVRGTAGETITAGDALYLNADGTLKLLDVANTAATAVAVGIALNGASANQPVNYMASGTMTINSVALTGQTYWGSSTAGGIWDTQPTTGRITTVLGVGLTTTSIQIGIINSGAVVP